MEAARSSNGMAAPGLCMVPPRACPPHQTISVLLCRVAHTRQMTELTHSLDVIKAKGPESMCISPLSAKLYFLLVHLLTSGPQVTYLFAEARF